MTLVPLWVVLWRRAQAGAWTVLAPADRNAAWTPPPAPRTRSGRTAPSSTTVLSPRPKTVWLWRRRGEHRRVRRRWRLARRRRDQMFTISRQQAADIARRAVEARGVTLGPQWRCCRCPTMAEGARTSSCRETAGERGGGNCSAATCRCRGGRVRVATFEGDLAERAEEWRVYRDSRLARTLRVATRCPKAGRARRSTKERRAIRAVAVRRGITASSGERAGPRSLGPSSEAESADRLDVHVRGHHHPAAAAGRASNRRRDRRR